MPSLTISGSPLFNGDSSCRIRSSTGDRVQAPVAGMDESQGWMAARMAMGFANTDTGSGFDQYVGAWRDDDNNLLGYSWEGPPFGSPGWALGRKSGGTGFYGSWLPGSFASGGKQTVIFTWTGTLLAMSLNGAAFSALANSAVPVLSATLFDIGGSGQAGRQIESDIYWFAWGSGVLTDANASTINGFGDTDHPCLDFPGNCLGVWYGVDATFVEPSPPQLIYPDADNVTAGWSTAPLFSKVNETSPDGTVITATAA